MKFGSVMSSVIARGAAALLAVAGIVSCNSIFTDQSDCPRGVSLRFVYDYNMEYVNSFHKQGHCVNVYVFDESGRYVDNWVETGDVIRDEDWRMKKQLEAGTYTLIAYGGLCCDGTSFFPPQFKSRSPESAEDSRVVLKYDDGQVSDKSLHPLFYGISTVEIGRDDYVEDTIYFKKNTNNIRSVLQQLNGEQVRADQFDVRIEDDNSTLDLDNNPVPAGTVTYLPWVSGESVIGTQEDGETPVSIAFYEISTSRLTTGTSPRLIVTNKTNGETIINIPLNTYLLLLKSELYADMPAQEFLDRVSEWSLVFFLDSGNRWYNARIIVNDWVVRLNQAIL